MFHRGQYSGLRGEAAFQHMTHVSSSPYTHTCILLLIYTEDSRVDYVVKLPFNI